MNGGSSLSQVAVEKLGQDLWELIFGAETVIPEDTPQNGELRRKWRIKCGKALFALRTSLSKDYIQHVRDMNSPKEVWETLERLFTQKNTMGLQFLENELVGVVQGTLSIPDYFLKVKTLCYKVSELDSNEPISDARLRRYLIRGLRQEFMPFISSVQGWTEQPSVIDLKNLLSNQEALLKQMSNSSYFNEESALYTRDNGKQKFQPNEEDSQDNPKTCFRCGKVGHFKRECRVKVTCSRCGKSGHIKKFCRVKLREEDAYITHEAESDDTKWEHCFSIEIIDDPADMASAMHPTEATVSIIMRMNGLLIQGVLIMLQEMLLYCLMFDHMKANVLS